METVEVVIRIPKEKYKLLTEMGDCVLNHNERAIKHGTILPKGHGKLIDSNVLWDAFQDLGQDFYEAFDFAEANAVIEADEGASNETG